MKRLAALFLFLLVLSAPVIVKAEERSLSFNVPKDYDSCTVTIELAEEGTYSGYVMDAAGNTFPLISADGAMLVCTISNLRKGELTAFVSNMGAPVGQMTVKLAAGAPGASYDPKSSISVGKDIAGLKIYFEDSNCEIDWTQADCDNVIVKIINLENNVTLANETVVGKHYSCEIPKGVDTILVSVVPSESANIQGAAKTFTLDVFDGPDASVIFTEKEYSNEDTTSIILNLKDSYGYYVDCNGTIVDESGLLEKGSYDVRVPLTTEGINDLKVFLVDADGNRASFTKSLIRDTQAPRVTFMSDYDGITVNSKNLTIEGKAYDFSTLQVNGEPVSVKTDGYFSYDCEFHTGSNVISVFATDLAENDVTYDLRITFSEARGLKGSTVIVGIAVIVLVLIWLIRKLFFGRRKALVKKSEKDMPGGLKPAKPEEKKEEKKEEKGEDKNILKNIIPFRKNARADNDEAEKKEKTTPAAEEKTEKQAGADKNLSTARLAAREKKKDRSDQKKIDQYYAKQKRNGSSARTLLVNAVVVILIVLAFTYLLEIVYIPSESMAPTCVTNDFCVGTRKMLLDESSIVRGSVIIFTHEDVSYVKRVIAVGGDTVEFRNGEVFINDSKLDESEYVPAGMKTVSAKSFTVPDGKYFVMGDNRVESYDSRYWTDPYISYGEITSEVSLVIPLHGLVNRIMSAKK